MRQRSARWRRGWAVVACVAAALVPPPADAQILLSPVLPGQEFTLLTFTIWLFSLPLAAIVTGVHTVVFVPLVGLGVAALWATARTLPRDWSARRSATVLAAVGMLTFALAGAARAVLLDDIGRAPTFAAHAWDQERRWALQPLILLGAAVGIRFARARAASRGR